MSIANLYALLKTKYYTIMLLHTKYKPKLGLATMITDNRNKIKWTESGEESEKGKANKRSLEGRKF